MGVAVDKVACPRCRENGMDKRGDNLVIYQDGSYHCFACGYTELSEEFKDENGLNNYVWIEEEIKMAKEPLTEEQKKYIKDNSGIDGKKSRGISNSTFNDYLVRFEYDGTGNVEKHLYPITEGYVGAGYKIRKLPKDFSGPHYGRFNQDSDLFGQWRFKNSNANTVVITAGEIDCLSAYEILENYRKSKNSNYEATPVVSSVIGETSSPTQLKKQYEWLDRFDKIILCYDQDKAGRDAVEKAVRVLPKNKVYIMQFSLKDTNEMLVNGKSNEWLTSFFKAKLYTPDGIVSSASLSDKVREAAMVQKIPLPPFMRKLEDKMAGGIVLKAIVNIGSASGTGKSTLIDECIYYWIFNSPHKIGIVTLEADSGEYGTKLLSRHLGRKINLIKDTAEKLDYLNSPEVLEKEGTLWTDEHGAARFHLIEDRDGGLESMKKLITNLITSCDAKVIILDPLQDILDGMSNEDQAVFMRWMKGMVKSHDVTFININHVRKSQGGQKANSAGADLYEEDFQGSSSIFKSGACNILFTRNKEAEDEVERNTTYMKMTKCRWTGNTGIVGEYYYDNASHTMWDKEDWLKQSGNSASF